MVAAGMAVGMTAALAVLIQVLEQLAPLVVVAVLALMVLHVIRRRGRGQTDRTDQGSPRIATLPSPAPISAPHDREPEPILRWGPPTYEDRGVPAAHRASITARRAHSRTHPSRPAGGRRP